MHRTGLQGLAWALLQALVFAASALWAFDLGHRVAGAWLGLLMGLNAGVFAVMFSASVADTLRRWKTQRVPQSPSA